MFYTIYKITNVINGKFYIGKHKTKCLNDGYMGSGKILKRAISKYGVDNFHKEILYICETENHMNLLERILVVPDPEINYNLCEGGKGGFSFINKFVYTKAKRAKHNKNISKLGANQTNKILKHKKEVNDPSWIRRNKNLSTAQKKYFANGGINGFSNKKHTEDTKKKIGQINSLKQTGTKNSQYGTCWISKDTETKKIKKEELDFWIKMGYSKGRNKASVAQSVDAGVSKTLC